MTEPFEPRPIDLPTPVPLAPDDDLSVLDEAKILAAPDDPAERPAWRSALLRWRDEARVRLGYDDALYAGDDPWAATAWNVAMVWLWDEALRDWHADRFDVGRLLASYEVLGGLDAVVLWHAYPVIGIDPRSQFDWYTEVPGLRQLVDDLHAAGVRVFLDYNPWDVGTERSTHTDADRLTGLLTELGADGLFLDTLREGDAELSAAVAALSPRPVLEGESRVPLARVADQQASWAQWFADSRTPGVLRARWFEQRHMMHHTRRWNRDHGDELRSAWVNGAGVLLWDVVFGVRVDWSERDAATLRAMRRVHQAFGDLLVQGDWEPLTDLDPAATQAGVAGSRWTLDGRHLYTLANPTDTDYTGPLLPESAGPAEVVLGDGSVPARGIAGLVVGGSPGLADNTIVATDGPTTPPAPVRVPVARSARRAGEGIRVAAGEHRLTVRWRQRETGLYEHAPYVGDWKPLPPRLHQLREAERTVDLDEVVVDAAEVTNAEFAAFVADGHRPASAHRLLRHWADGAPVPGTEDQPVTHVDLDDARAYARWRGARLPTEDELQVASLAPGFVRREPLVWQWTESEHRDGRTRWVVLKGGSWFAASGSEWYVDGGPHDPEWSLRYLLTGGGTSRSACIGFRCAVDLAADADTRDDSPEETT